MAEGTTDERLYIVFGSSGEYSDWTEWPVAAYRDEALARTHAEQAAAASDQRNEQAHGIEYSAREKWIAANRNPWDAHDDCDGYEASRYTVGEVPLLAALPSSPVRREEPDEC